MTPEEFKVFAARPSSFGDFAGTFKLGSNDGTVMQYAVFENDGYFAIQTNAKTVAIIPVNIVGGMAGNAAEIGSIIRENVHTAYNAGIEYGLTNHKALLKQRNEAQEGVVNGEEH